MKRILTLAFLLVLTHTGFTQTDIVSFRISKPYCLLNFLTTCAGDRNASYGLIDFVEQDSTLQTGAFQRIVADWQSITHDYAYLRDQYPEHRTRSRHGRIGDLLIIAAVQADDLADFRRRAIGLLPNADHQALFRVLEAAAPYYDRLVWQPQYAGLTRSLDSLRAYQPRISRLFAQLNVFYRGSWPADMPFTVALYPVPGRSGTAATPHVNALCVGVGEGDTDYDGIAGVVLHEMCHSIYNEQPAAVQAALERYFLADSSRSGMTAYDFIDEGLATACGNGWAREALNGQPDTNEWYHNEYIDGYGHGLYPLVKDYLSRGASIDSAFVRQAVGIFNRIFPRAANDYGILFGNLSLYSDAEDAPQRDAIINAIYRNFRITSFSSSSPILNATSLDILEHSDPTQLVVLPEQHPDADLAKLKAIFPQLAPMLRGHTDAAWVVSFYDAAHRPVIIVRTSKSGTPDKALAYLKQTRYLDTDHPYHAL